MSRSKYSLIGIYLLALALSACTSPAPPAPTGAAPVVTDVIVEVAPEVEVDTRMVWSHTNYMTSGLAGLAVAANQAQNRAENLRNRLGGKALETLSPVGLIPLVQDSWMAGEVGKANGWQFGEFVSVNNTDAGAVSRRVRQTGQPALFTTITPTFSADLESLLFVCEYRVIWPSSARDGGRNSGKVAYAILADNANAPSWYKFLVNSDERLRMALRDLIPLINHDRWAARNQTPKVNAWAIEGNVEAIRDNRLLFRQSSGGLLLSLPVPKPVDRNVKTAYVNGASFQVQEEIVRWLADRGVAVKARVARPEEEADLQIDVTSRWEPDLLDNDLIYIAITFRDPRTQEPWSLGIATGGKNMFGGWNKELIATALEEAWAEPLHRDLQSHAAAAPGQAEASQQ